MLVKAVHEGQPGGRRLYRRQRDKMKEYLRMVSIMINMAIGRNNRKLLRIMAKPDYGSGSLEV